MEFSDETLNLDGLVQNPMLSLGDPHRDVEESNLPASFASRRLSPDALEDLFQSDQICQRVCSLIPNEIVRAGWEVSLPDAPESEQKAFKTKLPSYFRRLKLARKIKLAMTWSNVYNEGAGVLLDVVDGQPRDQPVRLDSIRSLKLGYVLDGETLSPVRLGSATGEVDYFIDSLDYGIETMEHPSAPDGLAGGMGSGSRVHPSRVLWFEGVPTPPRAKSRMGGSVGRLQQFWNAYQRLETALQSMSNTLHRSQVLLMGMEGMLEMMAATGGGAGHREQLKAQMESIFYMANNLGMVAYDSKRQKFDILKRDVSNYPTAIKILKEAAIAASGLGEMALFGVTNVGSGLSGQDMRDRLHLAEQVANTSEGELREPLEMLVDYALHSEDGPTKGKAPDDWILKFKSSLTLTPSEQADLVAKMAPADKTYSELVPGLAESLVVSRFGSGEWSPQTQIPSPLPKPPAPPPGAPGAPSAPSAPGAPPAGLPGAPPAGPAGTSGAPASVDEDEAAESFAKDVLNRGG